MAKMNYCHNRGSKGDDKKIRRIMEEGNKDAICHCYAHGHRKLAFAAFGSCGKCRRRSRDHQYRHRAVESYQAPEEFNFEGLEAGVKVLVFYTEVDGKRVINDLEIVQ